jgi:hypothetical protein
VGAAPGASGQVASKCLVMALLGHGAMSDLSLLRAHKRTCSNTNGRTKSSVRNRSAQPIIIQR